MGSVDALGALALSSLPHTLAYTTTTGVDEPS
jgi:hypothetical protein